MHELHRALGPVQLVALGIGAIIGAGIFVITGHAAAAYAGPGVVISFIIAGLGCLFAGLCYAEFASMIPVAGSAYTYTYATMGKFLAWIIGWNLVLEYMAAASTVAVGWSGYFVELLSQMGITIPKDFSSAPIAMTSFRDVSHDRLLSEPACHGCHCDCQHAAGGRHPCVGPLQCRNGGHQALHRGAGDRFWFAADPSGESRRHSFRRIPAHGVNSAGAGSSAPPA